MQEEQKRLQEPFGDVPPAAPGSDPRSVLGTGREQRPQNYCKPPAPHTWDYVSATETSVETGPLDESGPAASKSRRAAFKSSPAASKSGPAAFVPDPAPSMVPAAIPRKRCSHALAIAAAGAILAAGSGTKAAGQDFEPAGPDFKAARPDLEAAGQVSCFLPI